MKILLALFAFTVISNINGQGSLECTLGVRIYPLKYVGATQTIEFKLGMKSSCSDFDSYNFFLLPYNVDYALTRFRHPKSVMLQLFGKVYMFTFNAPKHQGKTRFFDILYSFVTVKPAQVKKPLYTFAPNNMLLVGESISLFSKDNIEALAYKNNPCICQLSDSRNTMFCTIN